MQNVRNANLKLADFAHFAKSGQNGHKVNFWSGPQATLMNDALRNL